MINRLNLGWIPTLSFGGAANSDFSSFHEAAQPFSPVTPLFAAAEPPLLTGIFAHREGGGGGGGNKSGGSVDVPWAGGMSDKESLAFLKGADLGLKIKFELKELALKEFLHLKIEKEDSPMRARIQSAIESLRYHISVIERVLYAPSLLKEGISAKVMARADYLAVMDYVKRKLGHPTVVELLRALEMHSVAHREWASLDASREVLTEHGFESRPIEVAMLFLRAEEDKWQLRCDELREAVRNLSEVELAHSRKGDEGA